MITELQFPDEETHRQARDIYLSVLEKHGYKPKPDLSIIVSEKYGEEVRRALDAEGIQYRVAK